MMLRIGTGDDAALWHVTREGDGWWRAHCAELGLCFVKPSFADLERQAPLTARSCRRALAELTAHLT
jgi:hypothetical protein